MERRPAAFLSYVRSDDRHDDGRISQLRERLEGEVRVHTGEDFPIFQDRADIRWGQEWQARIDGALDAATFFIPILTPGFFKSPPCRSELEIFLEREKSLGRRDLVLPIYYVDTPGFNDLKRRAADPLAAALAARQYVDWRELRLEPFSDPQVGRRLALLAVQIRDALERLGGPEEKPGEILSRDSREVAAAPVPQPQEPPHPSAGLRSQASPSEPAPSAPASSTLIVGIGGTGKEVLLRLRRRLVERHGSLARLPFLQFLHLDTDTTAGAHEQYNLRSSDDPLHQEVRFQPSERIDLTIDGGISKAMEHSSHFPQIERWLPSGAKLAGLGNLGQGAGQVRSAGRLAFFHAPNFHRIATRLEQCKGLLRNDPNIFVIASLAGGTGSGLFLDLAFLLRSSFPTAERIGILLLPGFFSDYAGGERMRANGCAALLELQHYSLGHPFLGDWDGRRSEILPPPPFTTTYLIDQINEAGLVIGSSGKEYDTYQMIADALLHDASMGKFPSMKRAARVNLTHFNRNVYTHNILNEALHSGNRENPKTVPGDLYPTCFSSFGLAALSFPTDRVHSACACRLAVQILDFWLKSLLEEPFLPLKQRFVRFLARTYDHLAQEQPDRRSGGGLLLKARLRAKERYFSRPEKSELILSLYRDGDVDEWYRTWVGEPPREAEILRIVGHQILDELFQNDIGKGSSLEELEVFLLERCRKFLISREEQPEALALLTDGSRLSPKLREEMIRQAYRLSKVWLARSERGLEHTGLAPVRPDQRPCLIGVDVSNVPRLEELKGMVRDIQTPGDSPPRFVDIGEQDRGMIIFYNELAGVPAFYPGSVTAPRGLRAAYDTYPEKEDLHTDKNHRQFGDLLPKVVEEARQYADSLKAFVFGRLLGLLRAREVSAAGGHPTFHYSYDRSEGLSVDEVVLGDEASALDSLYRDRRGGHLTDRRILLKLAERTLQALKERRLLWVYALLLELYLKKVYPPPERAAFGSAENTVPRYSPEHAVLDAARSQLSGLLVNEEEEMRFKDELVRHRGKPLHQELTYEELHTALIPYCKPVGKFPEQTSRQSAGAEGIVWREALGLNLPASSTAQVQEKREKEREKEKNDWEERSECPRCFHVVNAADELSCPVCGFPLLALE